MAAQPSQEDFFSFVGGLNTEGGYFLTPKNTWKEGDNVVPQKDGSLERRAAIDFEPSGVYTLPTGFVGFLDSTVDNYAFSTHIWQGVGGDGNKNIMVIQYGNYVVFYDASADVTSLTKYTFQIYLPDYQAYGNDSLIGSSPISCADCYGKLVITSQDTDPIVILYYNGTFTAKKVDIKIRDFDGIFSPLPVTTEKTEAEWTALNFWPEALYNLYNQGWLQAKLAAYLNANSNKYPGNHKQWTFGKNATDDFDTNTLAKVDFGTSPAPKGRCILSAFNQDRAKAVNDINVGPTLTASSPLLQALYNKYYVTEIPTKTFTGLAISYEKYRPAYCSFFAGRVWFSGVPAGEKLGWVMFSQIITDISNIEKCHQQNDPTSETFSDLLDTDGGVIQIPEAGNIHGIYPLGKGLVVFATNGVWMISGADAGFTASNYTVDKISNNGCFSPQSIVKADERLFYWGTAGIYSLTYSPSNGATFEVLSDATIKTFFQDIPVYCRKHAEGKFNQSDKIIYWLYSDIETSRYRKSKLLCFDTQIGCFYTQTIDNSVNPIVVSLGTTYVSGNIAQTDVILDDGTEVIDDAGAEVYAETLEESAGTQKVKFISLVTDGGYRKIAFGQYSETRTSFMDWKIYDNTGAEVAAYVLTGYNLASSGPTKAKTGNYVTAFMKRTEETFDANTVPTPPSGCLFQTRWDFTDNSYTGKWSNDTQLYRINRVFFGAPSTSYDNGYPLVITKNKLRGRGKSIQMKFSSETGKDMKLVGWSATFTSNAI